LIRAAGLIIFCGAALALCLRAAQAAPRPHQYRIHTLPTAHLNHTAPMTEPLSYGSYLKVPELLDLQQPESAKHGPAAHDELLFIITHQTYELWFKQIRHELDAVLKIFAQSPVPERDLGRALHHLERVVRIERHLVEQVSLIETMTPLDFLDFRDLLAPSSGFQSAQWRAIENTLGLLRGQRLTYNNASYETALPANERDLATAPERASTVFDALDAWLSRTPFTRFREFEFWRAYRDNIDAMLKRDEALIRTTHENNPKAQEAQLAGLLGTREEFETVFDRDRYNTARAQGKRRLSYEAFLAALMICLYRDEPIFHVPHRLLTSLIEIDELMSLWRTRHMLMVARMIGQKIGTGGSSGQDYLRRTVDAHRVFNDLFNLSTYLLPRSQLPALPPEVARSLGFAYGGTGA
jgi:tryptophan 2,3-dioxygenase